MDIFMFMMLLPAEETSPAVTKNKPVKTAVEASRPEKIGTDKAKQEGGSK